MSICFNWRNRNRRFTLCSKVYPEQENITEDLEHREERWDQILPAVFSVSALLCPVLIVLMYGVNVCSGYFAMLVAMTYSVELFSCMIVGLVLGHALFNSGQGGSSTPSRREIIHCRGGCWSKCRPLLCLADHRTQPGGGAGQDVSELCVNLPRNNIFPPKV